MKKRGLWLRCVCLLLLCSIFVACADTGSEIVEDDKPDGSTQDTSHFHSYDSEQICEICGLAYQDEGLQFLICSEGYSVIGYLGEALEVSIPQKYCGRPVVRIDENAFSYRNEITAVRMPDTIKEVRDMAFMGCVKLEDIRFSESLISLGQKAFAGCTALVTLQLPGSLKTMGNHAFSRCTALRTLNLEDGLESIGRFAFRNCRKLESVRLSSSMTEVPESAFENCGHLKELVIPGNVKTIGALAFSNCDDMTNLIMVEGVEKLDREAFSFCSALKNVTMPTSIKTVAEKAFYNCENIENVHITDIVAWCSIQFYSNVSNPLYYADWLCSNGERLTEIVIPDESNGKICKEIRPFAFYNYDNLVSLSLPDSVTHIYNYAFASCEALSELYFGKGLKHVAAQAITGCNSLDRIYYAGTVESWHKIDFKPTKLPPGGVSIRPR